MSSSTSNKGDEWHFLVPLSINQQTENPVSCLKFDPYEELIWCGSSTGKVTSFSASNQFNRYSAFVSTRIGGVNGLEITEDVVFSLSDNCLRGTSRQGLPLSKYSSPSMTKMTAFIRFPSTTTFIMGGEQNKILQYDYAKEREVRTAEISESGATIIRYNGTNLYSADCDGNVSVRNAKTLETLQLISCHGDRISDFDVQGSKLITCGFSQKFKSAHGDPFVKVYDLRMYKALAPIPLAFSPKITRFLPSYCEKIIVASQSGGVRISEFNSNNIGSSFLVESNGISAFDFSSSKQFMAFGDYTGNLSIYCDRNEPVINSESFESIFAYPPVGPPVSFPIDDNSTPLATVPMPFPEDDTLASDWPPELTQPMFRRMKPVEEYEEPKVMHYVTQVKNPRINSKLRNHNVVPYIIEDIPVPHIENECAAVVENTKVKVSRFYKKCPVINSPVIRRGQNIEDIRRTYNYNPTNHVAIQSTYYVNAIVNPIVHFLYHLIAVRNVMFSHICVDDKCIACQLRFLFSMITDKSQNMSVFSTNLVRTLISNGFEINRNNAIQSSQNAAQHIMQSLSELSEHLNNSTEDIMLDEKEKSCLRTELNVIYRCVRCGALQSTPPSREYSIKLNYSSERKGSNPSFCQIVEKALHLGCNPSYNEEKECEDCKTMSRMEHKRRVKSLPSVLLIDTNPANEQFGEFWQRQLSAYERRPVRGTKEEPDSPSASKICRYGNECRNKKTCKFSHGRIDWELESSNLLEDSYEEGWQHYIPSLIGARVNEGIVRMTDVSKNADYDEPNADVYELVAILAAVGSGEHPAEWSHTVTIIKDQHENLPWTLMNEQLMCRLHENEAIHMDTRWKLPLMLAYRKRGFDVEKEKREPIPESMFYSDDNLASNSMTSSGTSEHVDLPENGELVGIDAEFIKIRWGRNEKDAKGVTSRAVGRVSCVDSTGTRIIFDDHVQVTTDEDVTDYLTQFSGIISDDLDASKSSKYLTTLKRVYLKILILVQRGCIFVGHALNNDFSVLNIHVPKEQIIDTVNLLRLDSHRLLSLQFLALQLLGEKIQEDCHDSVVDAQYALKIYRKYLDLKQNGFLNSEMRRIYDIVLTSSPMKSVSPANSLTDNK